MIVLLFFYSNRVKTLMLKFIRNPITPTVCYLIPSTCWNSWGLLELCLPLQRMRYPAHSPKAQHANNKTRSNRNSSLTVRGEMQSWWSNSHLIFGWSVSKNQEIFSKPFFKPSNTCLLQNKNPTYRFGAESSTVTVLIHTYSVQIAMQISAPLFTHSSLKYDA